MSLVPLAEVAPLASRHNPDCTPVMVPPALRSHCWLDWPLQSQMTTGVPLVVPRPDASRHLPPYPVSCLPVVQVQDWLAAPEQSYNCTWTPLVVDEPGTSTQRPDWPPTMGVGVPIVAAAAGPGPAATAMPATIRLSANAEVSRRRWEIRGADDGERTMVVSRGNRRHAQLRVHF